MEVRTKSHPARGAWIETDMQLNLYIKRYRRTPRGVRGLKLRICDFRVVNIGVAPRAGCVD